MLFASHDDGVDLEPPDESNVIEIGGRVWQVRFAPIAESFENTESHQPILVFVIGVLMTLLISAGVIAISQRSVLTS